MKSAFGFLQSKMKGDIHRSTFITIDIATLERWLDEYDELDGILIGEPFKNTHLDNSNEKIKRLQREFHKLNQEEEK